MHPGNERIQNHPDEEENSSCLGQSKSTNCIERSHRALTHWTHQVVQAQCEGAQGQEEGYAKDSVVKRVNNGQPESCVRGIDFMSQALRVYKCVSKHKDDEQENGCNQHSPDGGGGTKVAAIGIRLFTDGKDAIKDHSETQSKDAETNHHEINIARLEPEELPTKQR